MFTSAKDSLPRGKLRHELSFGYSYWWNGNLHEVPGR